MGIAPVWGPAGTCLARILLSPLGFTLWKLGLGQGGTNVCLGCRHWEGLLSYMVEVSGQQGRSRGLSPSQPAIGKKVAPVLQHQVQ